MIDDNQLVNALLEQGFLDQETLKKGLARTDKTGASLYETLITTELAAESDLVGVVSRMLNVPVYQVDPDSIPDKIRTLVPGSMARRNRVLPLAIEDDELVLGMADPIDVLAMDEIATHTGIDIRPVLVGPETLRGALDDIYGGEAAETDLTDEVLASFDDFDVEGMMDEVMAGDEWSDFFPDEEAAPSVEDSAVLSRDMRDRPSTDVLNEEDVDAALEEELPEIEILEELDKPVDRTVSAPPVADLDAWEVDSAITTGEPGDSEIVSAQTAEELFGAAPDGDAVVADVLEDTQREEIDPASDILADTQASHTTVGLGVDHLEDGVLGGESRPGGDDEIENTGRTELGVGPDSSDEGEELPAENTDYGALGRAILKTKPASEGDVVADAGSDAEEVSDADDEVSDGEVSSPEVAEEPPPDESEVDESEADESEVDEESEAEESEVEESEVEESESEESESEESESEESEAEESEAEESEAEESEAEESEAEESEAEESEAEESEAEESEAEESEAEASEAEESEAEDSEPDESEAEESEADESSPPSMEGDVDINERPTDPEPGIFDDLSELEVSPPGAGTNGFTRNSDQGPAPATDILQPHEMPDGDEPPSSDSRLKRRGNDDLTRPRMLSPAVALPEEIDAEGLALALTNLLVSKGILTAAEVFELAARLSNPNKD